MPKRTITKQPPFQPKIRIKKFDPVPSLLETKQSSESPKQSYKPMDKQRQMGSNQSLSINPSLRSGGTPTGGLKITGSFTSKPARRKKRKK